VRVSSVEFLKKYEALSDTALNEPVTITRNGRDRLVLVSAEEFQRMSRYAPRARRIEELTDDELAMISQARVAPEHDHLNALLDDDQGETPESRAWPRPSIRFPVATGVRCGSG
jgi:prevent-host-death family protein